VAFSPLGRQLALQLRSDPASGPCILIWDRDSGREKARFVDLQGDVLELSWIGENIISAVLHAWEANGRGVNYCLWDVRTAAEIACLKLNDPSKANRMYDVAVSADGSTLAYTRHTADGSSINVWDVTSQKVRKEFLGDYCKLAFSPNGNCLVAATSPLAPERIHAWDLASGKDLVELEQPKLEWTGEELHGYAQHICFSTDGLTLGVVDLIYPVDKQKDMARWKRFRQTHGEGEASPWYLVRTWELSTGKLQRHQFHWCVPQAVLRTRDLDTLSLLNYRFSRSRLRLVDPFEGTERLFLGAKGHFGFGIGDGTAPSFELHTTPQGSVLLLEQHYGRRTSALSRVPYWKGPRTYEDQTLKTYDRRHGRHLGTLRNEHFGCLSEDGQGLATFSEAHDQLNLWDVPLQTPWSGVLAWAILPGGLVGLLELLKKIGVQRPRRAKSFL
jgi:WD40 repeat protein